MHTTTENDILELKAEIQEVKEDGSFIGVASVYDVEDLTGDVIERGAFRKTISEMPTVPVLWQHMRDEVIGQGTIKEWQNKVLIEARLDIDGDPVATKAYQKLKKGYIKGLSIGFRTVKSTFEEIVENGLTRFVRHIQELKLFEVSVVTFPALPAAQVTRVKAITNEEARVLNERIESLDSKFQALQATIATLKTEPEEAKEPPPSDSTEPEDSTRGLVQTIDKHLMEIRIWN